jgi:hypothetical protein
LLGTIVRDFLAHGKTSAGLSVIRDNAVARRFYEKFGAQLTADKVEQRPGRGIVVDERPNSGRAVRRSRAISDFFC